MAERAATYRSVRGRSPARLLACRPRGALAVGDSAAAECGRDNGGVRREVLRLCRGYARGQVGAADVRAAVARLEEGNPTPAPARAKELTGSWVLVFTDDGNQAPVERAAFSAKEALTLASDSVYSVLRQVAPELAGGINAERKGGALPCQVIDAEAGVIANVGALPNPVGRPFDVEVRGSITPESDNDVSVTFESFRVEADGMPIVSLPLSVPIPFQAEWYPNATLATTYLDGQLRINRGRSGSLFVTVRKPDRR